MPFQATMNLFVGIEGVVAAERLVGHAGYPRRPDCRIAITGPLPLACCPPADMIRDHDCDRRNREMTFGTEPSMAPVKIFQIGGDLTVSRLGFGAMGLVGPEVYGDPTDPANSIAVLRRAVELGINFIDTAEAYGPEINERQIAEALAPYPADLVIATKCGVDRRAQDWAQTRTKGSRAQIRASCEGSLRRLKVERIDLYQLHRVDPSVPIEVSVDALAELQHEGKVRHIGLSEVSLEQLKRS